MLYTVIDSYLYIFSMWCSWWINKINNEFGRHTSFSNVCFFVICDMNSITKSMCPAIWSSTSSRASFWTREFFPWRFLFFIWALARRSDLHLSQEYSLSINIQSLVKQRFTINRLQTDPYFTGDEQEILTFLEHLTNQPAPAIIKLYSTPNAIQGKLLEITLNQMT